MLKDYLKSHPDNEPMEIIGEGFFNEMIEDYNIRKLFRSRNDFESYLERYVKRNY